VVSAVLISHLIFNDDVSVRLLNRGNNTFRLLIDMKFIKIQASRNQEYFMLQCLYMYACQNSLCYR